MLPTAWARGLNPSYKATPELRLPRKYGWVKLARILEHMGIEWTPPENRPDEPLRGADVVAWLGQIGWPAPDEVARPLADRPLNLAEFAQLVYAGLKASRSSTGAPRR